VEFCIAILMIWFDGVRFGAVCVYILGVSGLDDASGRC
jgi:hypothetical protein